MTSTLFIIALWFSPAHADDTCLNLAGTYTLPKFGTEQKMMTVKQTACTDISFTSCDLTGSVCELPTTSTLDGKFAPGCRQDCESFKAFKDRIEEKPKDGGSLLTSHGYCDYDSTTFSVTPSGNIVRSANVRHCEDGFHGKYGQTWVRRN